MKPVERMELRNMSKEVEPVSLISWVSSMCLASHACSPLDLSMILLM